MKYPRLVQALEDIMGKYGNNKAAVARKLGTNASSIQYYLEGNRAPGLVMLAQIAHEVGKTVEDLMGVHHPTSSAGTCDFPPLPPPSGLIPVVSMASANGDGPCWEDAYPVGHGMEMIWRPHDVYDPRAFGVKVDGDSMAPVFRSGDIVVVCPQKQVFSGDEVVARLRDGRVVVKVIRYSDGYVVLQSYNPDHEPIFAEKDQLEFAYKIIWHKRR